MDMGHRTPGKPTYHEWLASLQANPSSGGVQGTSLIVSSVVVMLVAILFGLGFFPPGRYPRFVLALPGLVIGISYFYAAGALFFKATETVARLVGLVVTVGAIGAGGFLVSSLL